MSTANELIISLEGLRLQAQHGVMPQERRVGATFRVDLQVGWPRTEALRSDRLSDTVSYADLYEIVKREMKVPSQLIEHVAGRIAQAIANDYPDYRWLRLKITKLNPPIGADCEGASIEIRCDNEQTV